MATTIQQLSDLSELVEFFKPQNLYLKPISRITVTVQLPVLKDPNKIISNWDIIEKLKRLIAPSQFTTIKVSKSSLEFVRFEAEFDNRDSMLRALKILDNANLKMIGFFDTFKVKAAEAKSEFPTRYAWDSFFRDAKNMDETRPGERPDTVRLEKLPCKWFQDSRKSGDKNEPSESVLRRVFEIFGDIRCVDIPQLDPAQRARINSYFTFEKMGDGNGQANNDDDDAPSTSKGSTGVPCVVKTYNLLNTNDFTFDAYVQFVEYISFVKAMDALRNMKLVSVDDNSKAYAANIKVDFDRSKHLSDKNIRRRRIYRERFLREEKIRLDRLRREEEERKRIEREERLKNELHKRYFEKQKTDRVREREEKRKIKQLERKRREEETEIERKIRHEERKLIVAQRKLESIRLLGCLFKLVAPVVSKQKVLQELSNLEEAQKREQEEKDRLEREEEKRRQRMLAKKEDELRAKILRKYEEKNYEREEYRRERLRKIVQENGTFLPSVVQTGKRVRRSYEVETVANDQYSD